MDSWILVWKTDIVAYMHNFLSVQMIGFVDRYTPGFEQDRFLLRIRHTMDAAR
jgi:hypothetical protein